MKILLVPNSYPPQIGGLEFAVSNIAHEFIKKGNEVIIVTTSTNLKYSMELESSGISVYRIPFFLPRLITFLDLKRFINSILRSLASVFLAPISFIRLFYIITRTTPHIVNLHYIGENAVFCLLLKKLINFNFCVNVHGNDIDRHYKRTIFSRYLTKKTLNNADLLLSNSSDILSKVNRIEPSTIENSYVVGNGVYPEEFSSCMKYHHSRKYILNVANFGQKKGQDILIRAFSLIQQRFPNMNLIFVGDGTELFKCSNLAKELKLSDSIEFLGKVSSFKIPSLLAGCELFVLPSRKEAFGIVVLEAMASKKPVVATRVGGVPEIIDDGINGILVEPENPEELAHGILMVLENEDLRKKLVRNGYNTVIERYTWPQIADKYIELYSRLLAK